MYGDEPTSVCIAYDQPGWGGNTYPSHTVFTGKELRELAYLDDRGGLKGLFHDLAALHRDNRDPSHASLYYMTLRLALTGTDAPAMDSLILRSCTLNLLFFSLSFFALYFLLNALFPTHKILVAFCLLLAYLNPISISNTLLAREYQLSECLFTLWGVWCWKVFHRIERSAPAWSFGTFCNGTVLSAALLSCGYFNALFIGLTGLCLLYCSIRHSHTCKDLLFYAALCIGSLMLCICLYQGFFNFLHDARTMEVTDKIQGGSWTDNLLSTFISGGYIVLIRMLTPIWAGVLASAIVYKLFHKKEVRLPRIPSFWLFACALVWTATVLWMAPWKSTRFIASALPLCMVVAAYYSAFCLHRTPHTWKAILVTAFIGYANMEYPIEHLERTANCPWPAHARRVVLFGPDDAEKNTLNLMIPYLGDSQECVIVERPEELSRYAAEGDSILYVYGESHDPVLRQQPGFIAEERFNAWMGCFTFHARQAR